MIEHKALLIEYRALLIEYRALLIDYRAFVLKDRALVDIPAGRSRLRWMSCSLSISSSFIIGLDVCVT